MRSTIDIDALCEEFDEQWESGTAGPDGLSAFLTQRLAMAWPRELLDELVQIDLERAWMAWCKKLERLRTSLGCTALLNAFQRIPRLSAYRRLLAIDKFSSERIQKLAAAEYLVRNECGDMIGPMHYQQQFCVDVSNHATARSHFVYGTSTCSSLRQLTDGIPLHGLNLLGRRRSLDAWDLTVETLGYGNRVVIAPVTEPRVSRQQLSVQILAPGTACLRNESTVNAISIVQNQVLDPQAACIVSFPFAVSLPNIKLEFH